jgi:soluble lytic murein transglycosylase-like protein
MTTYLSIITAAAKAAHVPIMLLYSICAHESRDFTLDYAMYDGGSPSYSVGQVKEDTARMLGFKGEPMELRNPKVGIKYSALYLKYQLDRYDGDWVKATSAYNAGTYNESDKTIGCPRNLKYILLVKAKLKATLRYKLECGKNKEKQPFVERLEKEE